MAEMVRTVEQGKLQETLFSWSFCAGVAFGVIELVPFGVAATPVIRKRGTATYDKLEEGSIPFQGPNRAQSGKIRVPTGRTPDRRESQSTYYLVPYVVGRIPGGA